MQVALYGAAGIAGDAELTRMLLEAGADPPTSARACTETRCLSRLRVPRSDMREARDRRRRRQDLVDYDLGRALNFPNPEMIEMFCNARCAGERRAPAPGGVAAAAAADGGRAARCRCADRRPRRARPHAAAGGGPLGDEAVAALLRERGAESAAVSDEDRALGTTSPGERRLARGVATRCATRC